MNIDERLEKLTTRHEALAQTVELIAVDHRQIIADLKQLNTAIATQAETSENLLASVTMLFQLARSHDERLGRLEGR